MGEIPNSYGAVDFSSLSAKPEQPRPPTSENVIRVPSLVMEANTQSLQELLALSDIVPLIVDLYTLRHESSDSLSQKLVKAVGNRGGALVLLRIDADANPQLVQAFQSQQVPAVLAILRSQPVALFAGDQSADSIELVLDKVLEAAASNGVSGSVIADSAAPAQPALPPFHQEAIEAIERGDYSAAEAAYQTALAQAPADALAIAGLAQVKLLQRTASLDYEATLSGTPTDLPSTIAKADALCSIGEFAGAFTLLLDRFEQEMQERDQLRQHLVELFKIAGTDAAVAPARARLTNLLF